MSLIRFHGHPSWQLLVLHCGTLKIRMLCWSVWMLSDVQFVLHVYLDFRFGRHIYVNGITFSVYVLV